MRTVLFLLAVSSVALSASAQVYRCQMPNGGTQFSDTPCPTSAVKAQRHMGSEATTSEWVPDGYRLQEQLESANRAQALKRAQVQDEAQRWAAPADQDTLGVIGDGRSDRERTREKFYRDAERRTARARLSPEQRAHMEALDRKRDLQERGILPPDPPRARSSAPPPPLATGPSIITNCDGAGCWDTGGNRYNNAAGGNFHRSDGKFCTRAGPNVICN